MNEAMASGLPVIVSDRVGCGPDLVRPGETGDVVPFGDIEALGEAMIRMAKENFRSRTMGINARQLVCREYNVERAVDGLLKGIAHVLG